MFVPQWMMRAALLAGLVSAVAAVRVVLAQHEPAADNTRLFTYEPVDGKGGQEVSGPYRVVLNWPQALRDGWTTIGVAIYVESPDRIYVAGRGEARDQYERLWGPVTVRALGREVPKDERRSEHIVCVYDRNGKLIESWEQWNSTITGVQRIQVSPYDPERHIWIATGGPILEFTHDGKTLVRTIGAKDVPQADPQDPRFVVEELAWMPNGDMYAAGGYQVMKFSKEGKYLSAFGKPGRGAGEFGTVGNALNGGGIHGVAVDPARHRIYISDRVNSRIEVFDENGKYLDQWPHIVAPYCIRLTKDGRYLWVSDGYVMKFGKYDALTGKLVPSSTWGTFGAAPGALWGIHYFTTDSEGNLYTAEDYGGRAQKFVPRKDGNPEQRIGQLQ